MHTTPLWVERDEDLRKAIHAVDPEELTTVFSAVPAAPPVSPPENTLEQTWVLPPALLGWAEQHRERMDVMALG